MSGYAKGKARLDEFIAVAGSKMEGWRLHDLRRTTATHLVRLGVLEEVVGRVLNHAPKGITAKVYALHTYAPERRALSLWAREVECAIEPRRVIRMAGLSGNIVQDRRASRSRRTLSTPRTGQRS